MELKKTISIEKQKQINVAILDEVHNYCHKNGIKYYIGFGTLLGAVRHGGFIPWDDDIDIIMFRNDYDQFIKYYHSLKYKCISFEHREYYLPYAKVIDISTGMVVDNCKNLFPTGVGIDIFPFDYLSNDLKESYKIKKKCNRIYNCMRASLYNRASESFQTTDSIFKKVVKIFIYATCKPFGWEFWRRKYNNYLAKNISKEKKKYCAFIAQINGSVKKVFESSLFENTKPYVFEDKVFDSIIDYNVFLKTVYGNYMKLPPEENRVPHAANAYFIEKTN